MTYFCTITTVLILLTIIGLALVFIGTTQPYIRKAFIAELAIFTDCLSDAYREFTGAVDGFIADGTFPASIAQHGLEDMPSCPRLTVMVKFVALVQDTLAVDDIDFRLEREIGW